MGWSVRRSLHGLHAYSFGHRFRWRSRPSRITSLGAPTSSRMQELWASTVGGQRRLILVAGEAGIGKTTLLASFARAAHRERCGSCLRPVR